MGAQRAARPHLLSDDLSATMASIGGGGGGECGNPS
eukprot:gene16740-63708_t